jgi:hypothetical protein
MRMRMRMNGLREGKQWYSVRHHQIFESIAPIYLKD